MSSRRVTSTGSSLSKLLIIPKTWFSKSSLSEGLHFFNAFPLFYALARLESTLPCPEVRGKRISAPSYRWTLPRLPARRIPEDNQSPSKQQQLCSLYFERWDARIVMLSDRNQKQRQDFLLAKNGTKRRRLLHDESNDAKEPKEGRECWKDSREFRSRSATRGREIAIATAERRTTRSNPKLTLAQSSERASIRSNRPSLCRKSWRRAARSNAERDRKPPTFRAGATARLKDWSSRAFQECCAFKRDRTKHSGWISMRWSRTLSVESKPSSWTEVSSWRRERLLTSTWGMFLDI